MSVYRAFIAICLLVAMVLQAWAASTDPIPSDVSQYICPPCGCSMDHAILGAPGICEDCQMNLIARPGDIKGSVSAITDSWFSTNVSNLYPKFIYPAFFVAILFGAMALVVPYKRKSINPYFGALLVILGLYAFKNQLYGVSYGLTDNYRSIFTPISFILFIGPALYFYTRHMVGKPVLNFKNLWPHTVPTLLVFLIYTFLLVGNDQVKTHSLISPYEMSLSHLEQVVALVAAAVYWFISYGLVFRSEGITIDMARRNRWLSRLHWGMLVLLMVWGVLIFVNYWVFNWGVATANYIPLWIGLAVIIYWWSIEMMINPKFFFTGRPGNNRGNQPSHQQLNQYSQALDHLMQTDKLYLNSRLSLQELADHLGVNSKYISQTLNTFKQQNFYSYVNGYRVQEVQRLLKDPSRKHLTIEALAKQAGFESKSSFNAVFKKTTQMTPKQYLRANGRHS